MTDYRLTIDPLVGSKQRALIEIDSERGTVSRVFMIKPEENMFWSVINLDEADPQLVELTKRILELF